MNQTSTDPLYDEQRKVLGVPAAEPAQAAAWFAARLGYETDPYDVNHDLVNGLEGFVVLDIRRRAAFEAEHVAGAVHFSHHDMTPESIAALDPSVVYVTYGWGPGCNGGVRAAAKLAAQGLRVKEMLGGIEYWNRQGFPTEKIG